MDLPIAKNRKEHYLEFLVNSGDVSSLPLPISDEERYLYALCRKGGVPGPKRDTGPQGPKGAAGKDGASIKSIVINVAGTAVSGTATLTDNSTVAITGTYSAS